MPHGRQRPTLADMGELDFLRRMLPGFRGGGDVLGTKQSGLPGFRLADPIEHEKLLYVASRDAALLLGKDPKLTSDRGRAVRVLLRLFERAAAMRTLAAG